ncbi:MAG: asparagine--tRNA ligase [Candidatus Diapherotrites archaeon CG_4_10_14_0_2_um_filter_31_5]|nr:MAG: asparagine--tRNA ligase [Candidatus Diapherotrites archaeon CG_4_10_14_0_2_um_filter_31_5]
MKEKTEFISIKKAFEKKGSISVRGWIKRKRELKDKIFVLLRDETGEMQCIIESDKIEKKDFEELQKNSIEASIELKGKLKEDSRAPNGFELMVNESKIIGSSENFPIQKDLSEEFLLDVRHLWMRSSRMTSIMKIRSTMLYAVREFYKKENYFECSPAIITPNACEGGTTLFPLKYFGEQRFLSQSGQMYLEVMIFALGKVFSLTPSFRAEKSKTARHLTEYWHLEGECAWMNMDDQMGEIEKMVSFICQKIAKENPVELKQLGRDPKDLEAIRVPFSRISYDEAIDVLEKKYKTKIPWGTDLSIKEEKILSEDEKIPFFIYDYPTAIKAFYAKETADPKKCFSFDLIGPEGYGELCTGGQREDVNENMLKKLKKEKIPLENYNWYLDLRKYGSVPHSGFGIGIERLLRWICKLDSIKETIPFPRTMNRSYP